MSFVYSNPHPHQCLSFPFRPSQNFSRRNGWKTSEPERMLEPITAKQIQATMQLQLGIALDPSHLLMDAPITGFGTYKIPLNLRTKEGVQAELTVNVRAVRRTRSGKMFG